MDENEMNFYYFGDFISAKEKKTLFQQQKGHAIYEDNIIAGSMSANGSTGSEVEVLI